MFKHTTLHLTTAKICRSHNPEMGVTNITSSYDIPTVGKPTKNTSDTYSLVDTTEKVVEEQVVDESLLISQRIIDLRLASVDPRDTKAPQRNKVRNKEEPHYWLDEM